MKRSTLLILIAVATAIALAATWLILNRGSATTATVNEDLPAFSRVAIEGAATLVLVQGSAEHIAVESSPRSGSVRAQVGTDGTLVISAEDHRRWWRSLVSGPARAPTITLTFRTLQSLRGNGAVKVVAERLAIPHLGLALNGAGSVRIASIEADELTLSGAGAVKADIAGRVGTQKISMTGAGVYRAGELQSDHATVAVSGAGKALVNAAKTLTVDISGAGSVEYLGDPKVTERVSGAGKVRRRDTTAQSHLHVAAR
jgi:hypothetical protein